MIKLGDGRMHLVFNFAHAKAGSKTNMGCNK
jgi:hypothetical protein